MADPLDESANAPSGRDKGIQARLPVRLDVPGEDEDDTSLPVVRRTPFPILILLGGILWIQVGAVYVALFGGSRLLGLPLQWVDLWIVLGAILFTKDGIQLMRGTAGDPRSDGVFSVLIGLFSLGQGVLEFGQPGSGIIVAFNVLFGLMFLAPGVLVLLGRKAYLAWVAEKAQAEAIRSLRAEPDLTEGEG